MLGKIIDQRFGKFRAVTGDGHRQRQFDRCAGFWVDAQPVAAVHFGQGQFDHCGARGHGIVVRGGERDLRFAFIAHVDFTIEKHLGRQIGCDNHLPIAATGALDLDAAGFHDLEFLRGLDRCFDHVFRRVGWRGPVRDRFIDAERPNLAVKAQRDAAADGGLQTRGIDIVEVDGGQAGVARRLQPAFPCGTGRQVGPCRPHGRDGLHAKDRTEHHGDKQRQNRHIAQGKRVCLGHPQIGLRRSGLLEAGGHPLLVGFPDGEGCCVFSADGLIVERRQYRVPRHRRIKTRQRFGMRGPVKPLHALEKRKKTADHEQRDDGPDRFDRHQVLQAQHEKGQRREQYGPERPEGPHHGLCSHTHSGQEKRPANGGVYVFGQVIPYGHSDLPACRPRERCLTAMGEWYLGL